MAYCRFKNTCFYLEDCYEALLGTGLEGLSHSERLAAARLILLCREIADDFEDAVKARKKGGGA